MRKIVPDSVPTSETTLHVKEAKKDNTYIGVRKNNLSQLVSTHLGWWGWATIAHVSNNECYNRYASFEDALNLYCYEEIFEFTDTKDLCNFLAEHCKKIADALPPRVQYIKGRKPFPGKHCG